MKRTEFILNDLFYQNAKEYQTRPLRAMKYQSGMENGWMFYITNVSHKKNNLPIYAGVKFFDTKEDAMRYVEANEPQYIRLHGELVECEVEYDLLRPVIYCKLTEGEERVGVDFGFGEYLYALVSDEQKDYDFFILEDNTWIIQDADGNVRVWEQDFLDCCSSTFFGEPDDFVYEKRVVSGKEEYIKVAV